MIENFMFRAAGVIFLCLFFPGIVPATDIGPEYKELIPGSRVIIDYGAGKGAPALIFYALPNGNTIEQTAGKKTGPGDDWRFDIQHIRAQTDFIRSRDPGRRYIVAYLEADSGAWTRHAASYPDSYRSYPVLADSVEAIVNRRLVAEGGGRVRELMFCSHSGGGRFVWDYIRGVKDRKGKDNIPEKVSLFAFIDSNYGFEDSLHTRKLAVWLRQSSRHRLGVFSYVDTTVVLNGKHIVAPDGGTGYKTRQMYRCLGREFAPGKTAGRKSISPANGFICRADTCFKTGTGLDGRVLMMIKENPLGKIYHTALVERNGFIHALFFATPFDEKEYVFWKQGRAYSRRIR